LIEEAPLRGGFLVDFKWVKWINFGMPLKFAKNVVLGFLRPFGPIHGNSPDLPTGAFKVLVVKQSERLGNIVLMNSTLDSMARAFPAAEIHVLLPAKFAGLMLDDPRIDAIVPVHKRAYIIRPWKLVSLLHRLRKSGFDLAVDCSDVNSHSLTGALYTILSGAKYTAGWKMAERKVFDIEVSRYKDTVHASEMYLRLFSGIFGQAMYGEPFSPDGRKVTGQGDSTVGINCGGRGEKSWGLGKFITLGKMLSDEGVDIEFILGPDEEGLRRTLQISIPERGRLLPLTPLRDLKTTLQGYSVFISSDTGPMHLAWSLRVPTLAIFLNSELEKFKPLSPGSVAIDSSGGLSPEAVFQTVMKMIKSLRIPS
jgi:ADP-heptose:LPS heptosyltransferase